MPKKKVTVVIPARMGSSRFPGKPLKNILDLPMIEHVRRRALLCPEVSDVVVATCDEAIMDTVKRFGGKAVMTASTHERCTDRVEEAMKTLKGDIVVILQGDEPLFVPQVISQLIAPMMKDDSIVCVNLLSLIDDEADLADKDIVKAVLDQKGNVMYFSRSPIPHLRVRKGCPMYRQTGISAFTKDFLHKFSQLPPAPLEIAESVDFLRILEHRYPIAGVVYDQRTVGVDQPDDIGIVENILRKEPLQKEFYQRILSV